MKKNAALVLCGCLAAAPACASPESDYLAARDKFIAKIKKMAEAEAPMEKTTKEEEASRADLEMRMKAMLGEHAVKGFTGKASFSPGSLAEGDIEFGAVDGLRYTTKNDAEQLFVSPQGLVKAWLSEKAKEKDSSFKSADIDAAFKQDELYTYTIGIDASFERDAELPVTKPEGVDSVVASLGYWTQDIGPSKPDAILVALRKGDKVYVAETSTKAKTSVLKACEPIWKAAQKKAEKAGDDGMNIENEGSRGYHACFNEHAPKEKFFPVVLKEAQALVDRVAGK